MSEEPAGGADRRGGPGGSGRQEQAGSRSLPDKVRQRVIEWAAEALGSMPAGEIPAALRRVARFEPRRRPRLAATQIATHLEADDAFRDRVGQHLQASSPQLAQLVEGLAGGEEDGPASLSGTEAVPVAADPIAVAAGAYLLRPPGWIHRIDEARAAEHQAQAVAEETAAADTIARLREQVASARASGREEIERLRSELRQSRTEVADLRRKLHHARDRARLAERAASDAREEAETERTTAAQLASSSETELRRLRSRLGDAEAAAEAARHSAREGRSADDARVQVLLDALVDASQGLRRELALPATIFRPADVVDAAEAQPPGPATVPGRAMRDDDPALLDNLLVLPRLHLIVDGYNVTMTGYGTLTLQKQRGRLLSGLGVLVAQSRAEITCVFDGAELTGPVPTAAPRGVRVLFSDPGETADALIRRLVRAEPYGRSVVVVSSDREIADDVRRSGARPVPANLLLRRLERG